jgi:superfamily II DNA or RNA helicase
VPRIFDNLSDQTRLATGLADWFPTTETLDVATGYFDLRGWNDLDDLITEKALSRSVTPANQVSDETGNDAECASPFPRLRDGESPVVRLLIGMVMPGQHHALMDDLQRQVDGETDNAGRRQQAENAQTTLVEHLRQQLTRGFPTPEDRATLRSLHDLVAAGQVQIRIYTRQPLHGKTYVFHRNDPVTPTAAVVGSSNFTRAGLNTNLELNTDITERDAATKVSGWFQDLWEDRWSLPVDDAVLRIIEESWAAPVPRSPYEVFLKVCYVMSRDVRAGLAQYRLDPAMENLLLPYQKTAVKTLAARLQNRRGTMLGDVVGLGKTLTAIAVAQVLHEDYGAPLIICPKNLETMWKQHLKEYDLPGHVVPYSMAHRELPELPRYRFAIIDESHTLRNDDTQTYQAVQSYLHENETKVLLLTATPYNIRYTDVANQLGLYLDDDEELGLAPTFALQRDPKLADRLEVSPTTLAAFRKSEEAEDWKRLMGEHLVRRTRSFVVNNYAQTDENGNRYLQYSDAQGNPGKRFTFPTRRAIPVEHTFDVGDPAALMTDDGTFDVLDHLRLPRYGLADYFHPDAKRLADAETTTIIENFENSRGQVAGFVRTNFYKRLSSCGYSFQLSLRRHRRRNNLFLYALEQGLPLPAGTLDPATLSEDATDEEALLSLQGEDSADDYARLQELRPRGVTWVTPNLFTDKLARALKEDTDAINGLLDRYGQWSVEVDSKVRKLAEVLTTTHARDKVLIFTEYKDTANYLRDALRHLGITRVEAATGETKDPTDLARRFSPNTNLQPGEKTASVAEEDQIRVLIATDVLSEGQNLQDAHVIINFDMPWAIIKLIQRAGRVDRVGQTADEVLVYTIAHGQVEDVLNLRNRIHERLAQNAATFGSDEQFFGTEEETQKISDLFQGTLPDEQAGEDVDAGSRAFEYWNQATTDMPQLQEKIENLPDLIDATRPLREEKDNDGIVCFTATDSGGESYGFAGDDGSRTLLTGHEALNRFYCTPETPALPGRDDHDDLVRDLVTGALRTEINASGRLRGERKILWNRLGQLTLDGAHTRRQLDALDALYKKPLKSTATSQLRSARRRGARDGELLNTLAELHELGLLVADGDSTNESIHIVASMGVN